MGLFSGIKNQLPSVLEWKDESKDLMVYRYPMDGREIMMGSKLTVRESQVAVFVNKGKIADIFEPGMYRLETGNLPILTKLMSWKTGFNSPFKADLYFVNTKQFTDQKWGTVNPIMMRDPELGAVRIRGFGKFSFKVFDAEKFLQELFGTSSTFLTKDITDYLKSMIISDISDTLAELKISALDITAQLKEISAAVGRHLDEDFKKIGLKLVTVIIENLSVPEEVEKMLDKRTQMGLLGDKMGTYMQYQAANAMAEAAKNPGGGLASAGIGLGAGVGLGQVFADTFKSGMKSGDEGGIVCPSCGVKAPANTKFCPSCGKALAGGKKCPKCGAGVPSGSKFCTECGFFLENKCPACGEKIENDAKFCPGCGKKL
jgi:membrane protease subunit (stomatin/prohibitin family)